MEEKQSKRTCLQIANWSIHVLQKIKYHPEENYPKLSHIMAQPQVCPKMNIFLDLCSLPVILHTSFIYLTTTNQTNAASIFSQMLAIRTSSYPSWWCTGYLFLQPSVVSYSLCFRKALPTTHTIAVNDRTPCALPPLNAFTCMPYSDPSQQAQRKSLCLYHRDKLYPAGGASLSCTQSESTHVLHTINHQNTVQQQQHHLRPSLCLLRKPCQMYLLPLPRPVSAAQTWGMTLCAEFKF